jgi:hypothetical protein
MIWHQCSNWSCEIWSHHLQWNDNYLVKWNHGRCPCILVVLVVH